MSCSLLRLHCTSFACISFAVLIANPKFRDSVATSLPSVCPTAAGAGAWLQVDISNSAACVIARRNEAQAARSAAGAQAGIMIERAGGLQGKKARRSRRRDPVDVRRLDAS